MKILVLFLTVLAGCSQSNNSPQQQSILPDETIEFQAVSINTSASGVIPSASLDFASLAFQQSAKQSLIISNHSSAPLVISAEDISSLMLAPFEISLNTCIGSIAARKKCTIEFKLSNSSSLSSEQIISSSLIVKGAIISLTGTLQAAPSPSVAPDVSLSVSPTSLQFGSMVDSNISELSIIIKNNATVAKPVSLSTLSSNKITISSNTCPASLGARKTCTVKFQYSAAGNEIIADQPLISISNYQVLYSVSVENPTTQNPVVITSVQPIAPPTAITLTQPNAMTGSVGFKNNGSSTFVGPIIATASHPAITISSVSCPAGLVRGRTCIVNFSVNSPDAPIGLSSQSIKLQSGTTASDGAILDFSISTPGPAVACSSLNDSELQSLGYTTTHIASVSGDAPNCVIQTCDPYYERAGGFEAKTCDAKLCGGLDSVELISLDYIDEPSGAIGYNPQEYLTGTYPACTLTCPVGFEPNPNNAKRCQPASVAVACSLANAAANGVNLGNVVSVRGNTPNCEVESCSGVGISPSVDLKSCNDALTLIGQAQVNFQNYSNNTVLKLANQDRIFFDVAGLTYNSQNNSYQGGHSYFFRQNGLSLGVSNFIENFQTDLYFTLPELFNGHKIVSMGQSFTIPEAPIYQMRTIDTSVPNLPSQIIYEESQLSAGSIDKLIRYKGTNNNDLLLMITRQAYGGTGPMTFRIRSSNSALTDVSTLLYESEDYEPTFGIEAGMALSFMSIGEEKQIGNKLYFSITRVNTSSNPIYQLFVFDGTSISIVATEISYDTVPYMGGSSFARKGVAVSDSKYYEMIHYTPMCGGVIPCFLNYYLIESDGTTLGTNYTESFNTTYIQNEAQSGNDFFGTAASNFYLEPQIIGSDSNGVYYSWFAVNTIGSYDYLNPPPPMGPGEPGLEGNDPPCSEYDFACTNVNYYQQTVNDQLKRINQSGTKDVLLNGKTFYAYRFSENSSNLGRDYIFGFGKLNNEYYFIHTAADIGKIYRTNGSSNVISLVEDINATNGLNSSSGLYNTLTEAVYSLNSTEILFKLHNRIFKKTGSSNLELLYTASVSNNYFKQKGNLLYFDEIDINVPGFAKFLKYTDGTSIFSVYNYPNLSYYYEINNGDILINNSQTRDLYILRPNPAD